MSEHKARGYVIKCQCTDPACPNCHERRLYIANKLLTWCQRTKYQISIAKDRTRIRNRKNNKVYREDQKITQIEQAMMINVKKRLTTRKKTGSLKSILEPVFLNPND